MRKPYLARLADLQASIDQSINKSPGELTRSFLAHEVTTTRNLKKSQLLTPELLTLISTLNFTSLTGSLPCAPHYSVNTIISSAERTFTLTIFNQKTLKKIYSQTASFNQEINKEPVEWCLIH